MGGLAPSLVVQLSNGGMAMVLEADEEKVVLDANSALAGKSLTFELEVRAAACSGVAVQRWGSTNGLHGLLGEREACGRSQTATGAC